MSRKQLTILLLVNLLAGLVGGMTGREIVGTVTAEPSQAPVNVTSSGEFRVLDPEGNLRILIGQSGIILFDSEQRQRIQIRSEPTSGIHVLDEEGNPRLELFLYPAGKAHLYLHDSQARLRTVLDEGELTFLGEDQSEVMLSRDERLPGTLNLSSNHPLGPVLAMRDNLGRAFLLAGRETVRLAEDLQALEPRLLIFDYQGKLLWSAIPKPEQQSNSIEEVGP